jgi:apolipoprotein N-acyltransferase
VIALGGPKEASNASCPGYVVAYGETLQGSPEGMEMSNLARSLHTTLLAGVTESLSASSFRNEVVAWSPDGRIVGTFEKVHRVPFGEYVPYRGIFEHLASLCDVMQDAVPGHGTGMLATPAARVGLMVSYEVFFAARGRSSVRAGAQLLVVPTNTSSYSTSQVPTQEIAAARLQAVEEGRDLVQAAPTGYSALIDHEGRVHARSVLGSRQVLLGDSALRSGHTIYERYGDLPVLIIAGLATAAGWIAALYGEASRTRRRR